VGAYWCWRLRGFLAHVEAGLRSESLLRPFPEEINRRIVSRFARIHFVQDEVAKNNLKEVGVTGEIVLTNGNTLYDALEVLRTNLPQDLHAFTRPFIIANIHRHENLISAKKWRSIIKTLLYAQNKMPVYLVMHPPTEHRLSIEVVDRKLLEGSGVVLLPRITFTKFISLINQSTLVISDGGSNQEECAYLGKPCLIMREETERIEGLGRNCVLSKFDWQIIQKFIDEVDSYQFAPYLMNESPSDTILRHLFGGVVKTS
jgi:UDP-N-acetylglucosamine 2-epimerase (non-hydrolysing)